MRDGGDGGNGRDRSDRGNGTGKDGAEGTDGAEGSDGTEGRGGTEGSDGTEGRAARHRDVGARARLLAAAVDHVARNGLGNLSLRRLGEAVGSSHRMLLYHFGSRDGLVVEIARAVELRQRDALVADLVRSAGDPVDVIRRLWARLTAPDLAPNERLFFELYGRALNGDPGAAPMLESVVDGWVDPLLEHLTRPGGAYWLTRHDVRLGLAVVRGLLLDLLATGDVEGTTEALETFLDRYRT